MTRAVVEGQQGVAPGSFEQHLEEGAALLSAGRLEEALGYLESAHAQQPGNDKGQNLLGLCCFKLGHLDRAAEIYELLVRDNPVDATLRVNLGLVYLKANALQRAVREFETATDLAPDHHKAHNYLGLALAQAGEYGRAREHFVLAGSDTMAERMARALDGGGFEPGSTPAGGTLVVRARPSQVPSPAEHGSRPVPEAARGPVLESRAPQALADLGASLPTLDVDAPTDEGEGPAGAESHEVHAADGGNAESSGGEGWDDDWNLDPVGGEISTAPDGGPVASLRPARLEDSWGAQFGLEGEAPESGEAAEELVVELNADDEEPQAAASELDFGAVPGASSHGAIAGDDAGAGDGWIDGGADGWDDGALAAEREQAPEIAGAPGWSGEGGALTADGSSPEAGVWHGEGSALDADGSTSEAGVWHGEGSALDVDGGTPGAGVWHGEGSALDADGSASDAGVWNDEAHAAHAAGGAFAEGDVGTWQDDPVAVEGAGTEPDVAPQATWGVPAQPLDDPEENWAGFEPTAPDSDASAEFQHAANGLDVHDEAPHAQPPEWDRTTQVPIAAPEPDWARAGGSPGQVAGPWLAELARGLVLGEPLSGDEAFSVAPDGVTAIRLRDGLRTRTAGFLALEGQVELTPEPRRKHGRATGQTFGPAGRELLRVRGAGLLHVRVSGRRLVPLELGEEGVYLREHAAYAFEESVMFENGSLSEGEDLEVGVVHLRGAGRILLELEGELRTVAVREGAAVSVELSRLVGWLGEVAPRLLPAVTGLGARVELRGSGFALLDAAPRGLST